VDFAADRFRLHAAGYWVEKGRVAEAVSETLVEGRLSELLRAVEAVGDDLKFVPSGSGGAGSPTLFVPKWKGA
jgi:PmbA protein